MRTRDFMVSIRFIRKLLIALALATSVHALNRPDAPEITSVVYDTSSGMVTVKCNSTMSDSDSCHVLLVTDFTTSLQLAYETANSSKHDGTAVTYAVKDVDSLSFELDKRIRERYFVAAAVSHRDSNNISTFSAWNVYTDADGLPISFSTVNGDHPENLICRARRIGESGTAPVVADISFSLPTSDVDSSRLALYKNGVPIIDVSLNTASGVKTSVKDAVENTTGIDSTLILRRDTLGSSLFSIYRLINMAATDTLSVEVVRPDSSVLDTTQRKPGVISDSAYGNIQSTIYALCRMPDTSNPVYQTALSTTADSTVIRLLTTAMLDKAITHCSPKGEPAEEAQGIFTNYMQFFDEMVRNWGTIGDTAVGLPRLRMIFNKVLENNRGDIVDPVWVKNHGTCYGVCDTTKRNNYAFYNGFIRLNLKCTKPDYGTGNAGTGLLYRIDTTIALYGAWSAANVADFDSVPIIDGSVERRIIFSTHDSLINRFINDSGGVWIQGGSEGETDRFYIGVTSVRLPLYAFSSGIKIDTAFSLATEKVESGDAIGQLVGGAEKSVFKMYAFSEEGATIDTLRELRRPGVLLHHQKRLLTFNEEYQVGPVLRYQVLTEPEDTNKLYVIQDGHKAILLDTSVTVGPWTVVANMFLNGLLVGSIGQEGRTRKIGLKDAENSFIEVWGECNSAVSVAIETNGSNRINVEDRQNCLVKVSWSKELKVYKDPDLSDDNLLWPKTTTEKKESCFLFKDWNEYENKFLNGGFSHIYLSANKFSDQYFEIQFIPNKKELTKYIFERAILKTVTIQKIPLGGSAILSDNTIGKIYVPTRWGGELSIDGSESELFYTDGSDINWNKALDVFKGQCNDERVAVGSANLTYEVPQDKYGWYYFRLKAENVQKVTSTFIQKRVAMKLPWNCEWFPNADDLSPNLYDDNGALHKYEQAFPGSNPRSIERINLFDGGEYIANSVIHEKNAEFEAGYDFDGNGTIEQNICWDLVTKPNAVDIAYDGVCNYFYNVSWHGHCNNVTAAIVCEEEPMNNIVPVNGQYFIKEDKKALLTALYHGSNYVDIEGPDARPGQWHYILEKYLIGSGVMVGADIENIGVGKDIVWNYPVYEVESMVYTENQKNDVNIIDIECHYNYWNYWDIEKARKQQEVLFYCVVYQPLTGEVDRIGSFTGVEEWITPGPDTVYRPQLQQHIDSYWQSNLDYTNVRSIVPLP